MKLFLKSTLAIFLPWVIMIMDDNPGGMILALILQATVIGWIPASMWAWGVVHKEKAKQKTRAKAKSGNNQTDIEKESE